MAKDTLLEIVQDILSEADGDEVNSISDTIESDQVARVVRNEFKLIVDEFDIKMHVTLIQLDATGAATPCEMTRPEGFHSIQSIYYDKRALAGDDPLFQKVSFRDPDSFLEMTMQRNESDTNVETMALDNSTFNINIRNDEAPTYWTILEGYDEIIFDSYDSSLETNLQASKTLVKGTQRPTLALTDAAVPDLPQNLMQLLKNRARAFFFDVYMDGAPPAVRRRENHSEVRSQRKKYVTTKLQQQRLGPDYGRK